MATLIQDLPDDVILYVLRLVDARTRARVSEVCTAWRALASCRTAHPFLYSDVHIDGRVSLDASGGGSGAHGGEDDGDGSTAHTPAVGPRVRLDAAALSAWLSARSPAVRRLVMDDALLLSETDWERVLGAVGGLVGLELAGDAARTLPWSALPVLAPPALADLAIHGCEGSLGEPQLAHLPPGLTSLRLEAARAPTGSGLARSGRPFLDGFPAPVLGLTRLRALSLASRGVGALPSDLTPLAGLTRLCVMHATLTALPPGFTALARLRHLDLRGNLLLRGDAATAGRALAPLCALAEPGGGCAPPRLTYLNLSSNGRRCDGGTALPPGLFAHTALLELRASDNPGLSVPPSLARLASCRLLDLRSCGLKDYPPGLDALTELRTLLLGRNARVARSGFASAGSLVDLERGGSGAAAAAAAAAVGVDAVTGRLAALSAVGGQLVAAAAAAAAPPSSSPPSPPPTPAVRRCGATAAAGTASPPRPPPFPPTLAPTFGTSIRVLDLSRSGLAAVPPAAASLTALTELRLRGVTAYPGTGFDWSSLARTGHSLRVLDVSGCHLETLPVAALAALPHLRELVAKEVGLVSLDPVLSAGLPAGLRVLRLDGNRLPLLPAAALAALPALEAVSLTDNLAMQLPPDLARLAGLRHLRRLDARKVARGLCGARPWTARSMWHLARAYADLAAADGGRDWSTVLLL